MSALRCPRCRSSNAYCNGLKGARHQHHCADCGYDGTTRVRDLDHALADEETTTHQEGKSNGQVF